MKIYFDCETNSKNCYTAEMIEGYFLKENGDSYYYTSRINNWSLEAEEIHGIKQRDTVYYDDFNTAMQSLVDWLPNEFNLIIYANYNTQLGHMLYDEVVLKSALMTFLDVPRENNLPYKITSTSVHSLSKECDKLQLFDAIKNPDTKRKSFTQENVFLSLFGRKYEAHRAKEDVYAMREIYLELTKLKVTGKSRAKNRQLELIYEM